MLTLTLGVLLAAAATAGTSVGPDSAGHPSPAMALALVERAAYGPGAEGVSRLVEPDGVATDAFGRVYVADATLHTLQRWDADGRWLDVTGTLGSEPTQFRRPGAVARWGSSGVVVLDVENRRIVAYDVHLRLQSVLVDLRAADLEQRIGAVTPVALASDRGGALYLADADRDRVLQFEATGGLSREFGGVGARAGAFAGLAALAVAPHGELVSVERPRGPRRGAVRRADAPDSAWARRCRLQRFDAGARLAWSGGTPEWAHSRGEGSFAAAVDDSGRIAVANEASGEVVVLAPDGTALAHAAGLASPRALAFAPDGTLLVAEAGAARVRRFALVPTVGQ